MLLQGVLVRRGLTWRGGRGTLECGFGGEVEGEVVVEDAVLAEGAVRGHLGLH